MPDIETIIGDRPTARSVTVVGAGLAGLATACALAVAGYRVNVLERRPYVGGRASSYEHPGTGEVIDNCQHILLGCCTNLIDFYERLGVAGQIRWFDRFTFLEPGGRSSVLAPQRAMPAPLHASLSFLWARAFSFADKRAIARGMRAFLRGTPEDTGESFAEWLRRHKQTHGAIERFWKPVLASALNEDPERISVFYANKVFREVFLFSAEGGRMGIPAAPLSELYGHAVRYIEERGGRVHLRSGADALHWNVERKQWEVTAGATTFSSDALVLALAFEGMSKLLPQLPDGAAKETLAMQLSGFEHSPITSVHLWFDRPITELDHAVLLDTTMQWLYNKSRLQPGRRESAGGYYVELVVSASKSLVSMERQQIIDLAMRELALFFPEVREAKLLKAAVTKEVRATYSVRPGLDRIRPAAASGWPGLFLAGDWTATGWPSTMEGAVRSGYLAAEAVVRAHGGEGSFLRADLPARGLMRLIG